ncbi:formyltransferase family protein [Reyranella sp.]|uniref:formyltransferase family protein n=1 Tax=Reyranella sp. TaxID=1929291 RepID=UPI003F6E465B
MPSATENRPKTRTIVFCHIDSLCCLPALNAVFAEFGNDIGLVLSSRRFGSSHGTFWEQTTAGFRRFGIPLNLWLGFDLISVPIVAFFARWLSRVTGRPPALATMPELARHYGARFVETSDVNSAETLAAIRACAPDFIVVMNFDQILQPPLIGLPKVAALNVHPSLLPKLRGPCPVLWAQARQDRVSGATVHAIEDRTIDAGRIIAQVEVPIDGATSVGELTTQFFSAGARALPAALARLSADRTAGRPQQLSDGQYLGYPTALQMKDFRRAGLRLCRLRHAAHLVSAALGVTRWKP